MSHMIYTPEYPKVDFLAYHLEHETTETIFLLARYAYGLKLGDVWIGDTQDHCGVRIDPKINARNAERNTNDPCVTSGIYPDLWLCEKHQLHRNDLMALNMLIDLRRCGLMQMRAEGLYGIDMTGASEKELGKALRVMFNEPVIPIDAPSPDEVQAHVTGVGMEIWLTEAMARMIRLGLLERVKTDDNKLRARPTPYGRLCTYVDKDTLSKLRGIECD